MKHRILITIALLLAAAAPAQTVISYWAQNSNNLPGGGFGFTPASFPQPADVGEGTLTLANFLATVDPDTGAYTTIQSFSGNALNALPGFPAGGSLSPQGGPDTGNNGMHINLHISTVGFENIAVSWAQRGTATGFIWRGFSYSADGGASFTLFDVNTGVLTDVWSVVSYDLSSVAALNHNPNVVLRITLDGASSTNGNNRFDNILVTGTPAEPPLPKTFEELVGAEQQLRHRVVAVLEEDVVVEALGPLDPDAPGGRGPGLPVVRPLCPARRHRLDRARHPRLAVHRPRRPQQRPRAL